MHAADMGRLGRREGGPGLAFRVFLVLAICVAGWAAAAAQENAVNRESIDESFSEITKLLTELDGATASAQSALENVKNMDIEKRRVATDKLFENLKREINKVLDGFSPNSVLVDNLEGANARMIVLKRWLERQPPDYPRRDQLIIEVDGTIKRYGELGRSIQSGRRQAQNALRELARTQFYLEIESMVTSASHSVKMTENLVSTLRKLSTKVSELAKQKTPRAVPN